MADAKVQIGLSTDFLEGTSVDTPAGQNLFREGVVISDPDVAEARARITNTAPAADAYGLAVRVIGGVVVGSEVEIKNDSGSPIPVSGSVSVSNFPATQQVSGTVALDSASLAALETINVANFPATQNVSATDLDIRNLSSAQDSVSVTGSVSVSNFPATQAVSGTVALDSATLAALETINVGNFPATQAVSGTVTANLGTLNGAATAANQTTGNTSLSSIDGKLPDESGAWGYNAGVSGTLTVAANKRILAITATSSPLTAASMTINGGQTITIPAGTTITISPRANLTAPTLVFTSTTSYFVEFIE